MDTEDDNGYGGRRKLPFVFTEQGIAMLSAVLRSDVAIRVSIRIMDTFVEMRKYMANTSLLYERLNAMEVRQINYQMETDERFERVFAYISEHEESSQKVFFDGQIYDAFSLIVNLIQKAEKQITLIDGYVDVGTLNLLSKKKSDVAVTIYTQKQTKLTKDDVKNSYRSVFERCREKVFWNQFNSRCRNHQRYIAKIETGNRGIRSRGIRSSSLANHLLKGVLKRLKISSHTEVRDNI